MILETPNYAPRSTTVYDPTCGSGSLLIKVADSAPNGLSIYGQEKEGISFARALAATILDPIEQKVDIPVSGSEG